MPNILSKTVNFYELKVLNKGKPDESLQIDWRAELEKWAAKPFSEHYVGELHCSPELGYDLPILCIHRPINEKHKTTVDREKESIDDASKAIETVSWRLSESSVFIFIPGSTTVGVVKAGKSSPGKDPLLAFLNELLPPLDGAYWDMVPIISAGQEKRFKETKKGVTALEFTTIMSPQPDLLAPPEKDSLFGTFEKLSAEMQTELKVEVRVSLPKNSQTPGTRAKMRDLAERTLTLSPQIKNAKITLENDANNVEEILNLLEHNLTYKIEIAEVNDEAATFRNLISEANRVVKELIDSPYFKRSV